MRRFIARSTPLLAGLVSVSLIFTPRGASAQAPPGEAGDAAAGKSQFDAAVSLFRERNYRAALVEFRRAYELSHNYRVLYNVAQTEFEVQDYAGALRTFKKYLAEGGAEIEAERRAEVEADIKKLAARVAMLRIVSNTPGADVLVDDVLVGQTPLPEAVIVSAGRRRITVQKGNLVPVSRAVDIAGGDSSTVTVNLAEPRPVVTAVVPVTTASTPPRPPPELEASRTGFWVSFSATAVLAAGGAVAGGLAIDAYNDTNVKLATRGVSAAEVESAHSKTGTLAIAADVLGGAAIAMGVVTIIVGVTGGKSGPAAQGRAASVRLGPQGVQLVGRF